MIGDDFETASFNASNYKDVDIILVELMKPDMKELLMKLKKESPNVKFFIYAPEEDGPKVDASLILILFMAVFSVSVGSLWSGYAKFNL